MKKLYMSNIPGGLLLMVQMTWVEVGLGEMMPFENEISRQEMLTEW